LTNFPFLIGLFGGGGGGSSSGSNANAFSLNLGKLINFVASFMYELQTA